MNSLGGHVGQERAGVKARLFAIVSIASLVGLVGAADAHHSLHMYDLSKTAPLAGVVLKFSWQNPHSSIELMSLAGETWSIECSSPSILTRKGWKSDSLAVGDRVSMTIHPARDGGRMGVIASVTTRTGELLMDNR